MYGNYATFSQPLLLLPGGGAQPPATYVVMLTVTQPALTFLDGEAAASTTSHDLLSTVVSAILDSGGGSC